jgi:hypothetical protein
MVPSLPRSIHLPLPSCHDKMPHQALPCFSATLPDTPLLKCLYGPSIPPNGMTPSKKRRVIVSAWQLSPAPPRTKHVLVVVAAHDSPNPKPLQRLPVRKYVPRVEDTAVVARHVLLLEKLRQRGLDTLGRCDLCCKDMLKTGTTPSDKATVYMVYILPLAPRP